TWHCLLPPLHDHVAGALVAPGLQALGLPAPRGDGMRVALAGLALATAVRVVHRVHHHAAHGRADAAPALGAGLAVVAQVVLVVRQLAQGGAAVDVHLAGLARLQADEGVNAFARGELRRAARAARDLAALAGLEFDVG